MSNLFWLSDAQMARQWGGYAEGSLSMEQITSDFSRGPSPRSLSIS